MSIGRRRLIQLGAGSCVGVTLSPVPWKLLDDTAKWSQNWSWLPKLPRGERKIKRTRCTLCPGGCPVEAHCVGEQPVYLKGTAGALCAWGLGGHHLAYHPARLHGPNLSLDVAVARIGHSVQKGRCVILDQRPGRAMSELYRGFAAALPDGRYVEAPSRDGSTLRAMEQLAGLPTDSLGVDFSRLNTIVGVGTPLLDGWAAQPPLAARMQGTPALRLIQIEARQSATATAAAEWIAARPGTEAHVALSLEQRLMNSGPAMIIADGDACAGFEQRELQAIAALNLKLAREALTFRRLPCPVHRGAMLESIEDRSVQVLILGDATNGEVISWADIERTLAPGALIVSFSAYDDALSRRASIRIPSFAAYEAAEDVPTPPYSANASYDLAPPLYERPQGGTSPAEVLSRMVPGLDTCLDDIRKDRAGRSRESVGSMTALRLNGIAARGLRAVEAPALAVVSFGWRGNAAGVCSPLTCKLYQESGLRPGSLLARIHPQTAASYGLKNRDRAGVEIHGTIHQKNVCIDPAVLPGVIEIAECAAGARWTPATLRRLA